LKQNTLETKQWYNKLRKKGFEVGLPMIINFNPLTVKSTSY